LHLHNKNYSVPRPITNNYGTTFTNHSDNFFTLFPFIQGSGFYDDLFRGKIETVNARTHKRILDAIRHLVEYHILVKDTKIKDKKSRCDVSCLDFGQLQTIWKDVGLSRSFLERIKEKDRSERSEFDKFVLKQMGYVKKIYKKIKKHSKDVKYKKKDIIPIHADFHEGNLLYEKDKIKAVIDFDNSHKDYRQYELVKSMYYFSTINRFQDFSFEQASFFLRLYKKYSKKLGNSIKLNHKDIPFFLRLDLLDTYMFSLSKVYDDQNVDEMKSMAMEVVNQLKWVDEKERELINL